MDDFEVIDSSSTVERDRDLLTRQVRGLFNSQSIRIEEKGYLISLL